MMRSVCLAALYVADASACDSLSVLPSATVDGLGGMYGKNADRHRTEVCSHFEAHSSTRQKEGRAGCDAGRKKGLFVQSRALRIRGRRLGPAA